MTRIESVDWVRRVRCPGDKRVQYAELTDYGQEVLTKAAPNHVDHVRRLVFDHLNTLQVRQLGVIAEQILEQLVTRETCSALRSEDQPLTSSRDDGTHS
jgi:DNA-binding MarR family transcriptional regulator